MLQQTTVAAVVPRFERFTARWPTIEALAAAKDEEVLSEWAGLGYYARARNLIACARDVVGRGGFPRSAQALRSLPGIGEYTSAAIAAIAFGEDAPAVDTNVERVISRLHALERPGRGEIGRLLKAITPTGKSGDLAQALMDLGATICRPKAPQCNACPISADCAAFASGAPERFPLPKPRARRPVRFGLAYWIEQDDRLWLVRRPAKGLLGGMAALPGSEWADERLPDMGSHIVRHVFTHFALELGLERRSAPVGDGWWQPLTSIGEAGLPTLYRKAVSAMQAARAQPRRAA